MDIERLGPAAREQVLKELARRERLANAERRRQRAAAEKTPPGGQGSRLEEEYYRTFIWPKELAGQVAKVERHRRFELLPPAEYCGLRLPAAHYTPDFVIVDGTGPAGLHLPPAAVHRTHRPPERMDIHGVHRRRRMILWEIKTCRLS